MKRFGLDEIAVDVDVGRGAFPFKFGGQTRAAPIGKGVGFEITDVRDRFVRIDWSKTGQRIIPPFAIAFGPVKRRLPSRRGGVVHRHPTERQPEFRAGVAVIFDERDVFAVGDRPGGEGKGKNKRSMTGTLVVVSEAVSVVTDVDNRFVKLDELAETAGPAIR